MKNAMTEGEVSIFFLSLSLSLSLRKCCFGESVPCWKFKNLAIFHEIGDVNIQNEKPESKDVDNFI
jgi:hypothetical protein